MSLQKLKFDDKTYRVSRETIPLALLFLIIVNGDFEGHFKDLIFLIGKLFLLQKLILYFNIYKFYRKKFLHLTRDIGWNILRKLN